MMLSGLDEYSHVLVDTAWLADHLDDPKVRIIEVAYDPDRRTSSHIPNAVVWDPWADLLLPDERVNIPGAVHLPWDLTLNADGTFKPLADLHDLFEGTGVRPDTKVIPYCTLGGRVAHTWFVPRHLLGYPWVRLYDAFWLEWGQRPDVPVER